MKRHVCNFIAGGAIALAAYGADIPPFSGDWFLFFLGLSVATSMATEAAR